MNGSKTFTGYFAGKLTFYEKEIVQENPPFWQYSSRYSAPMRPGKTLDSAIRSPVASTASNCCSTRAAGGLSPFSGITKVKDNPIPEEFLPYLW